MVFTMFGCPFANKNKVSACFYEITYYVSFAYLSRNPIQEACVASFQTADLTFEILPKVVCDCDPESRSEIQLTGGA
jgi:hypothetical protein